MADDSSSEKAFGVFRSAADFLTSYHPEHATAPVGFSRILLNLNNPGSTEPAGLMMVFTIRLSYATAFQVVKAVVYNVTMTDIDGSVLVDDGPLEGDLFCKVKLTVDDVYLDFCRYGRELVDEILHHMAEVLTHCDGTRVLISRVKLDDGREINLSMRCPVLDHGEDHQLASIALKRLSADGECDLQLRVVVKQMLLMQLIKDAQCNP